MTDEANKPQKAFSNAKDAISTGGKYVRENKLVILGAFLLGVILAALLAPKRRKEPDSAQAVREWLEKIMEEILKQWPKVKKEVQSIQDDLAAQAQNLSKSLATQADEISKSLAAQAQNISKSVAAQVQDIGKNVAAQAEDVGKNVAAQAEEIGSNVAAHAQDIGKKLHFWSRWGSRHIGPCQRSTGSDPRGNRIARRSRLALTNRQFSQHG
jgi:hypothetical protein